jgi:hypothetical protein
MLRVVELIEPDMVVAPDRIMRSTRREYMPRQPSLPDHYASLRRDH